MEGVCSGRVVRGWSRAGRVCGSGWEIPVESLVGGVRELSFDAGRPESTVFGRSQERPGGLLAVEIKNPTVARVDPGDGVGINLGRGVAGAASKQFAVDAVEAVSV